MISDDDIFNERIIVNQSMLEFKEQSQFFTNDPEINLLSFDPQQDYSLFYYFFGIILLIAFSFKFYPKLEVKTEQRIEQE